jgi:N-acetyl-anhydromuramyl-L-alanine amidase AmpD
MLDVKKILIKNRTFTKKDGTQGTRYGYRGKDKPEWIVVHYTGTVSAQGKAQKLAERMGTRTDSVSTHYLVGEDGVFQCVKDNHSAYHIGKKSDAKKIDVYNANAIGVDLVEKKCDTKTCKATDCDWWYSDKVFAKGLELIVFLMRKYDIPLDHVVRHYDVTGKICPSPFVGNRPSRTLEQYSRFPDSFYLHNKIRLPSFDNMTNEEAWRFFRDCLRIKLNIKENEIG